MKLRIHIVLIALWLLSTLSPQLSTVHAQGTAFTYQGRLNSGTNPANGTYDFVFAIYGSPTGTIDGFANQTNSATLVSNGLFTVTINLGQPGIFTGPDRWLEIDVRTNGNGAYATLAPRQQLTPTPYAIFANTASNLSGTIANGALPASPNFSGTVTASSFSGSGANMTSLNAGNISSGTLADARLSANVPLLNGNGQTFSGSNSFGNVIISPPATLSFGATTRQMFNLYSAAYGIGVQSYRLYFRTDNSFPGGGFAWFEGGTHSDATDDPGAGGVELMRLNPSGLTVNGTISGNGALPWQLVQGASQLAQPKTGYLLTNNSLVTVTLPASPNVGDLVRISGVGAGGWKIAQNAGQSVLAANLAGNIGTTWTARDSSRSWDSIASSADGTKLVAAVGGGQIYTSTDSGVTWTPRDSSRGWEAVASSADGTKLVSAVYAGQIYTSTDSGVTWTPRDSSRSWFSVASSADGTKLVAAVNGGQIYTSTDSGMTWTPRDSSRNWQSVASSADGAKLVAAVSSGGQIYTSTDSGVTWTPRDSSRNWQSVASSADGTKLVVAVFLGQFYTSTDSGVTWTPRDSSRNWQSVASSADGTKLVATVFGGQLYTSTDSGVTWTPRDSSRNWQPVASSADGTKLVAAVSAGQIYTSVLSSVPSTTTGAAGYLLGNQNSAIELQYLGNGQFLPLSHEGIIQAF